MLLAIDIGNSDIVFGVNQANKWLHLFRIQTSFSPRGGDYEAQLRLRFLENGLKISNQSHGRRNVRLAHCSCWPGYLS
jgi:type III pantothenate kinase